MLLYFSVCKDLLDIQDQIHQPFFWLCIRRSHCAFIVHTELYKIWFMRYSFECVVLPFFFSKKNYFHSAVNKMKWIFLLLIKFYRSFEGKERKKNATSLNSVHFNVNVFLCQWQTPANKHTKWEGKECVRFTKNRNKQKSQWKTERIKKRCKQNAWWRLLLLCLKPILLFALLFYDAVLFRSFLYNCENYKRKKGFSFNQKSKIWVLKSWPPTIIL